MVELPHSIFFRTLRGWGTVKFGDVQEWLSPTPFSAPLRGFRRRKVLLVFYVILHDSPPPICRERS